MWNEPSTLNMRNLQSSPLPTFQSQCLLPKHHALLSDIYRQALPIAPLSPAPRLRTPVWHPPSQPLLLKTLCHRPPPFQPISSQSLPLFTGNLPDSIPCKVMLTLYKAPL